MENWAWWISRGEARSEAAAERRARERLELDVTEQNLILDGEPTVTVNLIGEVFVATATSRFRFKRPVSS